MSTALDTDQLQNSLRQLIALAQIMLTLEPTQVELFQPRIAAREAIIQKLPRQLSSAEKCRLLPLLTELKALDDELENRLIKARNAHCQALRQIHFTQEVLSTYQAFS